MKCVFRSPLQSSLPDPSLSPAAGRFGVQPCFDEKIPFSPPYLRSSEGIHSKLNPCGSLVGS